MNTVMASFNTTVRQMTEMSQWTKKQLGDARIFAFDANKPCVQN